MRQFGKYLAPVIAALVLISLPARAVDQTVTGAWQGMIYKLGQPWNAIWEINPDGTYHLSVRGVTGMVEERGQMNADGGRWSLMSSMGRVDRGIYHLMNPNQLSLIGMSHHPSIWSRVGAAPPGAAPPVGAAPPPPAAAGTPESASSNEPPPILNGEAVTSTTPSADAASSALSAVKDQILPAAAAIGARALSNTKVGSTLAKGAKYAAAAAPYAAALQNKAHPGGKVIASGPGVHSLLGKTPPPSSGPVTLTGEASTMVSSDFPLPAAQDDAEQFCIPGFGKAAASGTKAPLPRGD